MILIKHKSSSIYAPDPPTPPILGCMIDYALNYNSLADQDDGSCEFPNNSNIALIVESAPNNIPTHGVYVQDEYNIGFPGGDSIIRGRGLTDGFQFATNTELGGLIFSYGGLPFHIDQAMSIYPTTQMFMPLGSNTSELLPNPSTIPVIITCGAGDTHNITGYGPGLEFFDTEISGNPAIQSSLSNGRIAGLMMRIKTERNCDWWEARQAARATATRTLLTHPDGKIWNEQNGFGKIDAEAAIAYNDTIIPDPYINGGNNMYPFIP